MPGTYRTFIRSVRNWREYSTARKTTVDRGLTIDEARRACDRFNESRTPQQVRKGTKMEFTAE